MNVKSIIAFVSLLALTSAALSQTALTSRGDGNPSKLTYPAAHRGNVIDDYHGTKVADPYRWLEDLDSADTKAWVEAENKLTFDYLNQIPERAAIKARLTKLWDFERYAVPEAAGGRYFFSKNNGLQNQYVLYTVDKLDGQPRVLLDPNQLSTDGTVALGGTAFTED